MSESLSFEGLLLRVRAGDQEAARELVQRYEPAIRRAIHFRLADSQLARLFDSMDICQSVLASFFVRAAAGQFDLEQPDQLLKLLVAIARNKLALHARFQQRKIHQAVGISLLRHPGGVVPKLSAVLLRFDVLRHPPFQVIQRRHHDFQVAGKLCGLNRVDAAKIRRRLVDTP